MYWCMDVLYVAYLALLGVKHHLSGALTTTPFGELASNAGQAAVAALLGEQARLVGHSGQDH